MRRLRWIGAAAVSTASVMPFMIMEIMNARPALGQFPFALYAAMWLLALMFVVTVRSLARSVTATDSAGRSALRLLPRIILLLAIAGAWTAGVVDQMPCFLGVPNCD